MDQLLTPAEAGKRSHVSFCVTCMGRAHHLKRTLPINLSILGWFPETEIVILNYNSRDDLGEWVQRSLAAEMESGLVAHYHTTEPGAFFMAHAKNVAHRAAGGGIICNLDADNILTRRFVEEVVNAFARSSEEILLVAEKYGGAYGRTVIARAAWEKLGGYDEEMRFGWGYEDNDFRARARGLGMKLVALNPAHLSHFEHGDAERTVHSDSKHRTASEKMHAEMSRINLENRVFVANQGKRFGAATLLKNFKERVVL
jgi:hypothetical protein